MRRTIKCLIGIIFLLAAALTWIDRGRPAEAQEAVDFRRDIEPIFKAACVGCHGPRRAMGQLRLDARQPAMKGGISGAVIVPGRSGESRLLARILGEGGESRMPMGGDPLTGAQIELIRRWIDEGAKWPEDGAASAGPAMHWAYVKPVSPAIPPVSRSGWVRNPIDAFVLARLEKEGLAPSPEASRESLLRRVSLDLTGLPPSIEEIDAFLADKSPDAYEKAVDRLLASRHYGERWARPWLDLARYADSNGYEKDNLRVMWKYRDWVIDALNRDMPFDRFTIEQLAGDMLPGATVDQKIATGFHRNTLINQEGGIDPAEQRYEVLVDRVNTTSTVWLGSTLGCAQCHNHKYDPFSQKDYYRLYAFFENSEYEYAYQTPGQEFSRYVKEPVLDLPTPAQASERDRIRGEIERVEKILKTQTPELDAAQKLWEREVKEAPAKWTFLDPLEAVSTGGAKLTRQADRSLLASGPAPEFDEYVIKTRAGLNRITGIRVEAMVDESLPRGGPGRDLYGNFILSTIEVEIDGKPVRFSTGGWDDGLSKLDEKTFFNYEMAQISDRPKGWLINATADDVRMSRQAVFVPVRPITATGDSELTVRLKFLAGGLCQSIGRVRLSVTSAADPMKIVGVPAALKLVMAKPESDRTERERERLSANFRSATPLLAAQRRKLGDLQKQLRDLGIVTALIMEEKPDQETPATFIRERGSFLSPGEKVTAGTPKMLPGLPADAPVNRLGLARWLVGRDNPLTARVAVNRFWEQFFGRGIVETSEDFGSQGAQPSHKDLLDWLAVEFMTGSKWSMKSIHRLIVTSATYRQSSTFSPELNEKDPYNRLLARGPRFRMEAEMIRDSALAASGLLSRRIGGPSVMPPQPDGIWKNPYSGAKWETATDDDRYRRGLYTFIRRTSPYPSMMTFDATSREVCTVRRVRTNTPLQSLTLLNDDAYFEMARALAGRMTTEARGGIEKQIGHGFRLCTSRRPAKRELDRLADLYRQQSEWYATHPEDAGKVIGSKSQTAGNRAEMAALTIVANVLLNLDETISKQ
ncbi:MAG: DUF1553 domain-containing protein [Blastocatellales bacterium]